MRWFWIDRFTEFVSCQRATAEKNISLSEDFIHQHFPGAPTMPNSLIVEGMAQTAGLLVGERYDFKGSVVLAKVSKVQFIERAVPGDTLTYHAELTSLDDEGARATVTSHLGDRPQAEMEVLFANVDNPGANGALFSDRDFAAILRSFRIFDVGLNAEGGKLEIPEHLALAEAAASG